MKICVLQPDYSTSAVDYQYYDPPRNLSPLLPNDEVVHVFLNKLTTYKQLKQLSKEGFDVYVNLCEGYLEWEVPSIDVIQTLELLNLPFTGPSSLLYDPSKELMKYVAFCSGVQTPNYAIISSTDNLQLNIQHLKFPLFVKPAKAGDSLGIDEFSLVNDITELEQKLESVIDEYDEILVEEYIAGREFTVLVTSKDAAKGEIWSGAVEFIFPAGSEFKTYKLKTSELHPEANVLVTDKTLEGRIKTAALNIFKSFNGKGYARIDFRLNAAGELFFLEINFTCSVFYTNGYEGSSDYILQHTGLGQQRFLQMIIEEGIYRHRQQQKKYIVKGNSIAGYGIYAARDIAEGELIFRGEEKAQRIVSKKYVDENWNDEEKGNFARYAYPISHHIYILWDNNPAEWAPQNHSCNPNTCYIGLNVIALRPIQKNEELTLDYATILDETAQPFNCNCKSENCRGIIKGIIENSVEKRLTNL